MTRLRQWQDDPVTIALLNSINGRIEDLYLGLVRVQYDTNYDLKMAENRGRIMELQTLSDLTKLKELLDTHINWED